MAFCLRARHLIRLLDRFAVEKYPLRLLTMIVSLQTIFLSTFVMISQNRANAKRQVLADEQWKTVQEEDRQTKELLDPSKQSTPPETSTPTTGRRPVRRVR
jgi:uncharacterized membrane protein